MKKYVAKNRVTGETVFCKYELTNTCMLFVEFYLPKSGFSLRWDRKAEDTRICGLRDSVDGRKAIASYVIHPNYWVGYDISHAMYSDIHSALNNCLTDNIKLL